MKISVSLAAIILLAGCSSHMIDLKYQTLAAANNAESLPKIRVGGVVDSRGTASNWLGAIRGGYGNPLKKLYSSIPTSKAIAVAFEDALRSRNLLATINEAQYRVDIVVNKFDTSYYWNKEAHADITVDLVAIATGTSMFRKNYRTDNEKGGVGAGIFGDAEALGEFANLTLNQTIDKVLDDPTFLAALVNRPKTNGALGAAERLKELESLRMEGLISEQEYNRQRARVLGEI